MYPLYRTRPTSAESVAHDEYLNGLCLFCFGDRDIHGGTVLCNECDGWFYGRESLMFDCWSFANKACESLRYSKDKNVPAPLDYIAFVVAGDFYLELTGE